MKFHVALSPRGQFLGAVWPTRAEWKQTQTTDRFCLLGFFTLLRIWPDVDTFLMSFCGVPGSCSGSLSDDSSGHRPTVDSGPPASAILPSDLRWGPGKEHPPAADTGQHTGADERGVYWPLVVKIWYYKQSLTIFIQQLSNTHKKYMTLKYLSN